MNYKVLCIDDHEANLFSLEQLLSRIPEVEVLKALSGKDGLNILLEHKIDLILLDIQMPEMDGYEVAKILKKNQMTKNIPIIFVTAVFKSQEFIERGFEVGAIDYLTKPLDDNQLINRIQLYLNVFEERDRAKFLQEQYQNITEHMGEGLYVINADFTVNYINKSALKQLGYSYKEVINKLMHELIHYKDVNENPLDASDCPIHSIFSTQKPFLGEEHFVKKDGTLIPVLVSAAPIMDAHGVAKVIVIFQDMTQQIQQREKLLFMEKERNRDYKDFINSLVNIIEKRDTYTAGHSQRVAKYCECIAQEMQIDSQQIKKLITAAKLHDIGKISTPDSILLKPGKLESLEYSLIQHHLSSGYEILKSIQTYQEEAEIMRYHHERYDGKGYPNGVDGKDIPLVAHIMIVADSFDAMTTNRIYKPRRTLDDALEELQKCSGTQFHPEVVDSAIRALQRITLEQTTTQLPQNELEAHRFSYFFKDKLTKLFLPDYERLVVDLFYPGKKLYRYIVRLHKFGAYNKRAGWDAGNNLLIDLSEWLVQNYSDALVFRIEGDDFMIVSQNELHLDKEQIKNNSNLASTDIEVEVQNA